MSDTPTKPTQPAPVSSPSGDPATALPASNLPKPARWWHDWKSLAGTLLMAAVVVNVANWWQTRHMTRGPAPAFTAPLALDARQPQAAGSTQTSLEEFRARHPGKPVALYFWAEWCGICRANEHVPSSVMQDWPMLTIASQSGNATHVRQVLIERKLPWQTAVDERGQIAQQYGVPGFPALVILDAQGQIHSQSVGYTSEAGMRLRLQQAR